jgi:quercetin dioxygenase-like cupin family protein
MENMKEQSENHRTSTHRTINDSMVQFDLNQFIQQIKAEASWETKGHNSITVFKGDNLRIVLIGLKAGVDIKKHSVNAEISVQVLSGRMIFEALNEQVELKENGLLTLKKQIEHSVHALDETFFLLSLASQ